jgi:hypothetical protein
MMTSVVLRGGLAFLGLSNCASQTEYSGMEVTGDAPKPQRSHAPTA